MRAGKPISERSTAGVIGTFIVFPVLFGFVLLAVLCRWASANARDFTLADWARLLGVGVLVSASMTALPAVGWREWQRRRMPNPPPPTQRVGSKKGRRRG